MTAPRPRLTDEEFIEDLGDLGASGVGLRAASRRTGYTSDAIDKRLRRLGRADLLAVLRSHDPIPCGAVEAADRYARWRVTPIGQSVVMHAEAHRARALAADPVDDRERAARLDSAAA